MPFFDFLRPFRRPLPVWYDPAFRLPLPALDLGAGIDLRRADLALWHLLDVGALRPADIRTPHRIRYGDLARVHTAEYLESLTDPAALARIFAMDPANLPADALVRTIRLATGATLEAAREALARGGPTLSLLGGFHHAAPGRGGGFSAVNDIAVAVAAIRAEGFAGDVAVLDLDAHPPDGTAACLGGSAWIGSLSGVAWEALPGVDEMVLPGATDTPYLAALDALLGRMPRAALTFVVAGGDILAGDKLGLLALTLAGARQRDANVLASLRGRPSVWLPAGGYHADAWRVLAGTGLVLAWNDLTPIPPDADPLRSRFAATAASLAATQLGADRLTADDIAADLGLSRAHDGRLLGVYTAEGIELALTRYGILLHLERLGYADLQVAVDATDVGDRMRLWGTALGTRHLLVESVVARATVDTEPVLFVHWLTLRNPAAAYSTGRKALPGQEVPGLGMAREASELLVRMADRLHLGGVAYRPAWFHVARAGAARFRFVDSKRQGRFQALLRDLGGMEPGAAARAVAEGLVEENGVPYVWEPDVLVEWIRPRPDDHAEVDRVAAATTYRLRTEQPIG